MDFFVIGLSHRQTPVAAREKFTAMEAPETTLYARHAALGALRESLILSTCNRLEILAVSDDFNEARRAIVKTLAEAAGLQEEEVQPHLYCLRGLEAARHLFRVASSLDSLVLGEPQILGQVKEAFRQALRRHCAGPVINKLMHKSFRTAKRVRAETCLAAGTVSVASAAVSLARLLAGGSIRGAETLLLGAGPMAALAAAHLKKREASLVIVSRTHEKAAALAAKHGARSRPWAELNQAVLEADIIIAATGAQSPILSLANMEKVLAARSAFRPLTIIDIGVPRNVSHDLKHLEAVILRNIDDLNEVVWENRVSRQEAAEQAEVIIEEELDKFARWLDNFDSRPTVAALTQKAEKMRLLELTRTLRQHDFNDEQREALETMTSALVRRLLHDPLNFIKSRAPSSGAAARCAKEPGSPPCGDCAHEGQRLASIRRVFNIRPDETKPEP